MLNTLQGAARADGGRDRARRAADPSCPILFPLELIMHLLIVMYHYREQSLIYFCIYP